MESTANGKRPKNWYFMSVCVCICVFVTCANQWKFNGNPTHTHTQISSEFFSLKVPKMVIIFVCILIGRFCCVFVDCTTKSQTRNANNVISIRLEKKRCTTVVCNLTNIRPNKKRWSWCIHKNEEGLEWKKHNCHLIGSLGFWRKVIS